MERLAGCATAIVPRPNGVERSQRIALVSYALGERGNLEPPTKPSDSGAASRTRRGGTGRRGTPRRNRARVRERVEDPMMTRHEP